MNNKTDWPPFERGVIAGITLGYRELEHMIAKLEGEPNQPSAIRVLTDAAAHLRQIRQLVRDEGAEEPK